MKKTIADRDRAFDLLISAENDSETYFRIMKPTFDNLTRKANKGQYDSEKAVKAYLHIIDFFAPKLAKMCYTPNIPWYVEFTKATRELAAEMMEDHYRDDILNNRL